ncbi:MAG: hypothetical protein ACLFUU_10155 [Desulfobacteraceae bacterium]
MIYEYAIEPELVATWGNIDKYRYFYEQIGLGTPRIMSDYPKLKNWRRRVLQAAAGFKGTYDYLRIEELIKRLTEIRIFREGSNYDGNISWLENAAKEHVKHPFQAILARQHRDGNQNILTDDNLDTSTKWAVKRGKIIPKISKEMAEIVAPMLSKCNVAIFIDPHFGPELSRYRSPLKAFLSAIVKNRRKVLPHLVEVHTSEKSTSEFFKQSCEEEMPRIIPHGLVVIFKRWRERPGGDKLHPRLILTDIGGVKFEYGLDEQNAGVTDDVTLLEIDQYRFRWSQYASDSPAFDLADEPVEIIGTAKT